jgi:hypothetical protein
MSPDAYLAYLLELRTKSRRNPEALRFIDRGLSLVARASAADPVEIMNIELELQQLADDLVVRYGARKPRVMH